MNQTINLQIPVEVAIRNRALETAKSFGFSSLQDTIRLFLYQLSQNTIDFAIQPKPVKLSSKNANRYAKMISDLAKGKEKTLNFKSTKDMFTYLNDES
jgi:hypothetical protein